MEDSASEYEEDPTYEELKLRQDYWRTDELTSSIEAGLIAKLRCQDRYVYAIDCDPPKKAVNFICIHCGHTFWGYNSVVKHKKDCKVHPNKKGKKANNDSQRKKKRPIVENHSIPARRSNKENINGIPNDRTPDIGMPINELNTDSDSLPSEPESPMPTPNKSKSKRILTERPVPTRKSKRNRKQTK